MSKRLTIAIIIVATTCFHRPASARPVLLSPSLLTRFRLTKRSMSSFRKRQQFVNDQRGRAIRTPNGEVFRLSSDDAGSEAPSVRSNSLFAGIGDLLKVPRRVDRRKLHSPIRNQGNRSTCVSHACCALLEAHPQIPDDLSEQDCHWNLMRRLRRRGLGRFFEFPHPTVADDEGVRATKAADYLSDERICAEEHCPYVSKEASLTEEHEKRPEAAKKHAFYGFEEVRLLSKDDIADLRKMAWLIARGHDVVIAVRVAWDGDHVREANGLVDVVLDDDGEPAEAGGGHAMLAVGYDLEREQLIVRNSWGENWGDRGYCYMTADYLKTYARYGFWVKSFAIEGGEACTVVAEGGSSGERAEHNRMVHLLGQGPVISQ